MPLSKTINAIRRVESYLTKMVESSTNIHFPSDNPMQLNHHIRHGVHAAEHNKDRFPEFAKLKSKYIIRVRPDELFLELRDGNSDITSPKVAHSLSFPGITTLLQVIGVCIKHQLDELVFPDALLTEEDTLKLSNWASKHGYNVQVKQAGIILRKNV